MLHGTERNLVEPETQMPAECYGMMYIGAGAYLDPLMTTDKMLIFLMHSLLRRRFENPDIDLFVPE